MSVTLKTIRAPSNGARFHTADLHVHSFGGSSDVSDATTTVENIVETAVKDGIAILAITDHNTVQNVAPAVAYAERYRDFLLLIPGVEVSTAHGHLLVYFAPNRIEVARDFLALIKIHGKHGARDSHTEMSMASVINEAEKCGGICIAAHVDRASTGFHSTPGYPTWKKDVMCCAGLYGLEFDSDAHLAWFSHEDDSTDEGTGRKGLLGARAQVEAVQARCRLAAVQNSDAHTLADFSAQHTRRSLTRYKMTELSFDAFRTALVDSEARVRALATIPLTVPRVLGMHISGGFLDGCTFHFSDNLNCIIGGRGTGKSTTIKSLAYGLGLRDELAEHDNCPDSVVVYAEDVSGTKYRYERPRGGAPIVQAKEDQEPISEVPADAFRVEFYGQGELSEVGKDPLKNPIKLQEFLDRHISLGDLLAREADLMGQLQENSVQLLPLEAAAGLLAGKQKTNGEVVKKIGIAETGKLQEVVAMQSKVAAEKAVVSALSEAQVVFARGLSLAGFKRDYDGLAQQAGPGTCDARSEPLLARARALLGDANASLDAEAKVINIKLREVAAELKTQIGALNILHRTMDSEVAAKVAEFRTKGLTGDLKGLTELVTQRTQLTGEINRINNQKPELRRLRDERADLLWRLQEVRDELMTRRKAQLTVINNNLRLTVEEYRAV